jgi:hypothetical protein
MDIKKSKLTCAISYSRAISLEHLKHLHPKTVNNSYILE